jgi:diguanylate cyclase (GGDEF)-like protein
MHHIPQDILEGWQTITTLVAEHCDVPACLVMRGNPQSMEVMARADVSGDPYEVGETSPRNNKRYCETVIASQNPLEVVDANSDPVWRDNPDTKLGLFSYYGVPVAWPKGQSFGTFCILDSKAKKRTSMEKKCVRAFARVIEDYLRLIEASENFKFEASHDPLTGVLNRRIFFEIAQRQVSASLRAGAGLALVEFDIDHFKAVNDEFGHAVGDAVLKSVTQAVQMSLRQGDTLARIGGEEFVVLGEVRDVSGLIPMAERIRTAVEKSDSVFATAGRAVTISCGVSELRDDDTIETLMQRADEAMYEAKSSGRNCSQAAPSKRRLKISSKASAG